MPSVSCLVFDSHPIQYRAPVFRALSKLVDLRVCFFAREFDGSKWWFHERNTFPKTSTRPIHTEGYEHRFFSASNVYGRLVELSRILRTERPTHVLIFGWYLPENWMILLLSKFFGIRIIFIGETFSSQSSGLRALLRKVCIRIFLRGIDQFISIGKKNTTFYLQQGISKVRIVEAKYCVDTAFFEVSEKDRGIFRERVRRKIGVGENEFVLLFVGRIFYRKRVQDVVELARRNPKITLWIAGDGPEFGTLCEQTRSESNVICLGQQDQASLRELYASADLLCVSSEYETWGLVVNEAFASGLPALVTESCGVADDLVVPEKTGFVVPVGDIDAMEAVVKYCVGEPSSLQRLCVNAKEKVVKEFSIQQMADAIRRGLEMSSSSVEG